MKPQLQQLIKKAAKDCATAVDDCLLLSNGEKKCEAIITELVQKVIADAAATPPAQS